MTSSNSCFSGRWKRFVTFTHPSENVNHRLCSLVLNFCDFFGCLESLLFIYMINSARMVSVFIFRHDQCLRSDEYSHSYRFHYLHLQSAVYYFINVVIFNVFDLQSAKTLKFSDLILMFKSMVRGFAFLTNQPLPDINLL